MNRSIKSYLLIACTLLIAFGCRQAKYVQDGQYLLKSNEISFKTSKRDQIKLVGSHPQIDVAEMYELVRPEPNRKLKLFFFNRIDSAKLKKQVERKEEKYRKKNAARQEKEDRINLERIADAEAEGDSLYRHKVVPRKQVKLGWRNWVRSNLAQGPILLDTFKVRKSSEQMEIYLNKKGFFNAEITDTIVYNEKKKKAEVSYIVTPGLPYTIREFKLDSASMNATMLKGYKDLVEDKGEVITPGKLLDQDVLDAERERFTKYCRNEKAMLGFNRNYIGFLVDTTVGDRQVDITLFVKPKIIKDPKDTTGKTLIEQPHLVYRVRDVTFKLHNPDTASFYDYDAYLLRCQQLGLMVDPYHGDFPLLDTIRIHGKGTFIYNEIPFVDPNLLDKQNFLEIDTEMDSIDPQKKFYKEYYVERSYRTMSNLGVFSNITPIVEVDPNEPLGRWVVVTYDLTPTERQSFRFEPSVNNTNGILGIEGAIAYTNHNVKRGAQEFKAAFIGGMESQPLIIGTDAGGNAKRTFEINTFEIGPQFSLSVPRLFGIPKKMEEGFSKRAYPKSIFDLNINYQKRTEFSRFLGQAGFLWSLHIPKTQILTIKWVELKFVALQKEDFFIERLANLNDPFLINSYSDHMSSITSVSWSYSNLNRNERTKNNFHNINVSADFSGIEFFNNVSLLTPLIYKGLDNVNFFGVSENVNGLRQFFGVPYTQFVKLDGQYIGSIEINRKQKFVYRALAGIGKAWGNSPSLPYEQAFFAGGSNDIRAFKARTMAPGSYKTYADTNSTLTQIGDTRFEVNLEWRFEMTSLIDGAVFLDAGNIWNLKRKDVISDPSTLLKPSSWREVALGIGYGFRADFDFLIIRIDLAFALHNPHLPEGERWWLSGKADYKNYFKTDPTDPNKIVGYESPHPLRVNFGIGYPF